MLTIDAQKIIHVASKKVPMVASIDSESSITVETAAPGIPETVFSTDYTEETYPARVLSITGPINISGAHKGDLLKIRIEEITLAEYGKMWSGQWIGLLKGEIDHCFIQTVKITSKYAILKSGLRIPVTPMIGTIGTTYDESAVDCLVPGKYGGNMDARSITVGSTVYLPVFIDGAGLFVGDVHAAMGMGEVLGTGIETGAKVKIKVSVVHKSITLPIIESKDGIEIVCSNSDIDKACKDVTMAAIELLEKTNNLDFDDAYAVVGQACDLRVQQVVNPSKTVSIFVPKYIFKTDFI